MEHYLLRTYLKKCCYQKFHKRRSIVKHELPVKTKRVCKYQTLDEIQSHFWFLETVSSRWKLKSVAAENIVSSLAAIPSKSFLRLSFWNPCNHTIRAIPTYTIFICSDFKFQIFIDGLLLPSDHLHDLSLVRSNAATVKDVFWLRKIISYVMDMQLLVNDLRSL